MKKQYIAAIACILIGAVGFAAVYTSQIIKDKKEEVSDSAPYESSLTSTVVEPAKSKPDTQEKEEDSSTLAEPVEEEASEPVIIHFAADSVSCWPVKGDVLLPYSGDKTIYFPTLDQYQYSRGMVIRAEIGQEVIAAAPGRIVDVYNSEETGNTVVEELGDGYYATYGQLDEVKCAVGQMIVAGDVLGLVAEPSKYYTVEGSNVYFAIEKDGEAIDPMDFLADI